MVRIVPSVPLAVRKQKIDRHAPSARHYKDHKKEKGRVAKYIQDDAYEDNRPEVDKKAQKKAQLRLLAGAGDGSKAQLLKNEITAITRKELALGQTKAAIELKSDVAFLQRAVSYYPFTYYKALDKREKKEKYSYPDILAARQFRMVHAPGIQVTDTPEYKAIIHMKIHELRVLFERINKVNIGGSEQALYNRWKLTLFALALKLRDDVNRPASVDKIIPDAPEGTKRFVANHMRDADTYYISNAWTDDDDADDDDSDGIDSKNILTTTRKRGIKQTTSRVNALERMRNARKRRLARGVF